MLLSSLLLAQKGYYFGFLRAGSTVFLLRREPFFHKLRYSKVPKFDLAAPVLGAVVGAFAAYMTLSTLGSGGTDLSDLTTLVLYCYLWINNIRLVFILAVGNSSCNFLTILYEFFFITKLTLRL